jgi:pimeloyl-ACP methyl ester carboxylesterase
MATAIDAHAALAADFPAREPVRTFLFDQIAGLNPPLTPEFLRALVRLRCTLAPGWALPTCFIAGAADRLFPLALIRRAHARVPGAALVVVPDAGHSVYFERPDAFNAALGVFLGATADAPAVA